MTFQTSDTPLRLGISACLLGQPVRYDGGHKRDRFLNDQLGPFVEWVPVCPEVEAGMGVPRPSMRLVRAGDALPHQHKDECSSIAVRGPKPQACAAGRGLRVLASLGRRDRFAAGFLRLAPRRAKERVVPGFHGLVRLLQLPQG